MISRLICMLLGHPPNPHAAVREASQGRWFRQWVCPRCGETVTRWL